MFSSKKCSKFVGAIAARADVIKEARAFSVFNLPLNIQKTSDSSEEWGEGITARLDPKGSGVVSLQFEGRHSRQIDNITELKEWLERYDGLYTGKFKEYSNKNSEYIQSYNDGFLYKLNRDMTISKIPDEEITILDINYKYDSMKEISHIKQTGDLLATLESSNTSFPESVKFLIYLFENVAINVDASKSSESDRRVKIYPIPTQEIIINTLVSDTVMSDMDLKWIAEEKLNVQRMAINKL